MFHAIKMVLAALLICTIHSSQAFIQSEESRARYLEANATKREVTETYEQIKKSLPEGKDLDSLLQKMNEPGNAEKFYQSAAKLDKNLSAIQFDIENKLKEIDQKIEGAPIRSLRKTTKSTLAMQRKALENLQQFLNTRHILNGQLLDFHNLVSSRVAFDNPQVITLAKKIVVTYNQLTDQETQIKKALKKIYNHDTRVLFLYALGISTIFSTFAVLLSLAIGVIYEAASPSPTKKVSATPDQTTPAAATSLYQAATSATPAGM